MTDAMVNDHGVVSRPLGKGSYTTFLNLARSGTVRNQLGWVHAGGPERKPEFTSDYSAVVASLDLAGVGEEIRKGQRLSVPIDCTIAPTKYWATASVTPALAELFDVSLAGHYPPGYSGTPEIGLVAKDALAKADVPLAAVYIMLLA